MKVAVIGIGSNSVRALLAEAGDGRFVRISRDREGTRLFAGKGPDGCLSEESMRTTGAAVCRMAESLRASGVQALHLFATSAVRDAVNREAFSERLRQSAGLEMEIVSGEREAELSFLGARSAAGTDGRCGMIDIGGGSTEIAVGTDREAEMMFSCQMGAVRLQQEFPIRSRQDMARVEETARTILERKLAEAGDPGHPEAWVGTGGTFTTLAAMIRRVNWTDRTFMHGTRITPAEVREIGEMLADMDPEDRKKLPGMQPHRADIVVHGICILLAVMGRLTSPEITVSEYGTLDGYLLEKYGKG